MGLISKILKNKKTEEFKSTKKKDDVKIEKKVEKVGKKEDVAKPKRNKLGLNDNSDLILVSPLITEKAAVAESMNKYSFIVAKWASKPQIKRAVENIYGVRPIKVNVTNVEGKRVKFRRISGKKSDFKKAVVTLPKGKTIDIHKGV